MTGGLQVRIFILPWELGCLFLSSNELGVKPQTTLIIDHFVKKPLRNSGRLIIF